MFKHQREKYKRKFVQVTSQKPCNFAGSYNFVGEPLIICAWVFERFKHVLYALEWNVGVLYRCIFPPVLIFVKIFIIAHREVDQILLLSWGPCLFLDQKWWKSNGHFDHFWSQNRKDPRLNSKIWPTSRWAMIKILTKINTEEKIHRYSTPNTLFWLV